MLAGEPWCRLPWEVRGLTLRQFFLILGWPRDEHGRLEFERDQDEQPRETYQQLFYRTWRLRRLPEHHIDKKWRALQEGR